LELSLDKIERLLNLTACLLEARRPLTFCDLKDTVYKGLSRSENSLKRMFERDKDELREMGIEVETVESAYSDETGYIIPRDKYYLPHIDLEPQERVALTMVSRLFLGAGTPFSVPAQLALLKLAFEEQGAAEEVPHVHWVETPRDSELLGDILDSLLRRKFLTFTYRSLGADAPVEREVEPYGLFNKDGAWYFVGQCHLRGEVRCFKLERIASGVEVNPKNPKTPDFEVPEFFDMHAAIDWDRPLEGRVQFEAKVVFKALFRGRDGRRPDAAAEEDGRRQGQGDLRGLRRRAVRGLGARLRDRRADILAAVPERNRTVAPRGHAQGVEDMSTKVSQRLNRLLLMVPFLARPEGASISEICSKFKVDQATVMQDLATLQMCGVPEYTPADLMDYWIEGDRAYVMMADYFKRPLNMTRQEALSLFIAGSALIRSGVFEEKGALDSALAKIEGLLSSETKEELEGVIERVEVEMRAYEGTMREIIDEGLKKGMRLHLEYWTYSRDEMTSREVEPLSLICSGGFWYLMAWCCAAGDSRLFRLDRIASVALTDTPVARRAEESFDIPLMVGEYKPGKKAHHVKLLFTGRQGRRVVEQWPAATLTERADGRILIELRTRNLAWLATYLLRFGEAVRVESPKELRVLLKKKASELLEAYR
jgi:predicted DNA-binding transcriptional regulator YafY